jgi:hypothetical protein
MLVVFVRIPEIDGPVPSGSMPVRFEVLVLVHEKVVPATLFASEISIGVIAVSEQIA